MEIFSSINTTTTINAETKVVMAPRRKEYNGKREILFNHDEGDADETAARSIPNTHSSMIVTKFIESFTNYHKVEQKDQLIHAYCSS